MAFYRRIAPVIKKGQTHYLSPQIERIRHPEGWQDILRIGANKEAFALIHIFGGACPRKLRLPLPEGTPERISAVYSDTEETVQIEDRTLILYPRENWKAIAVHLV